MDDQERDEILYRLDTRTKRVDEHINRLDERLDEHEAVLNDHDEQLSEHENTIDNMRKVGGGIGSAILALLGGIGAKIAGFLHL